jgi:hypothetical protein
MDVDTRQIVIRVPEEEIVFLDQLFKSLEGLAMVTVDRKKRGIICLDVTDGTRPDVLDVLHDLKGKIPLQIVKS